MATFFRMRAKDSNPESNKAIFREWVVQDTPDTTGARYTGQKNGTLHDIVVECSWKTPEIINTGGGTGSVGPTGPAGEGLEIFKPTLYHTNNIGMINTPGMGICLSTDVVKFFTTLKNKNADRAIFPFDAIGLVKNYDPVRSILLSEGYSGSPTPTAELNIIYNGSLSAPSYTVRAYPLLFTPQSIFCEEYNANLSSDSFAIETMFYVFGNNKYYNPEYNLYLVPPSNGTFSSNIAFMAKTNTARVYFIVSSVDKVIYKITGYQPPVNNNGNQEITATIEKTFVGETPTSIKTFRLHSGLWVAFVGITNDDGSKYTKLYYATFTTSDANRGVVLNYVNTYNYDFTDICLEKSNPLDSISIVDGYPAGATGNFAGIVNNNGKIKVVKFALVINNSFVDTMQVEKEITIDESAWSNSSKICSYYPFDYSDEDGMPADGNFMYAVTSAGTNALYVLNDATIIHKYPALFKNSQPQATDYGSMVGIYNNNFIYASNKADGSEVSISTTMPKSISFGRINLKGYFSSGVLNISNSGSLNVINPSTLVSFSGDIGANPDGSQTVLGIRSLPVSFDYSAFTNGNVLTYQNGSLVLAQPQSSGGGTTFTASRDLSGSATQQTVVGLINKGFYSISTPPTNSALFFDGTYWNNKLLSDFNVSKQLYNPVETNINHYVDNDQYTSGQISINSSGVVSISSSVVSGSYYLADVKIDNVQNQTDNMTIAINTNVDAINIGAGWYRRNCKDVYVTQVPKPFIIPNPVDFVATPIFCTFDGTTCSILYSTSNSSQYILHNIEPYSKAITRRVINVNSSYVFRNGVFLDPVTSKIYSFSINLHSLTEIIPNNNYLFQAYKRLTDLNCKWTFTGPNGDLCGITPTGDVYREQMDVSEIQAYTPTLWGSLSDGSSSLGNIITAAPVNYDNNYYMRIVVIVTTQGVYIFDTQYPTVANGHIFVDTWADRQNIAIALTGNISNVTNITGAIIDTDTSGVYLVFASNPTKLFFLKAFTNKNSLTSLDSSLYYNFGNNTVNTNPIISSIIPGMSDGRYNRLNIGSLLVGNNIVYNIRYFSNAWVATPSYIGGIGSWVPNTLATGSSEIVLASGLFSSSSSTPQKISKRLIDLSNYPAQNGGLNRRIRFIATYECSLQDGSMTGNVQLYDSLNGAVITGSTDSHVVIGSGGYTFISSPLTVGFSNGNIRSDNPSYYDVQISKSGGSGSDTVTLTYAALLIDYV